MNHLSTQATALLIGGVILPLSSLSAQSPDTFEFSVVPAAEPAEPAPASTAATEQTAATGVVTGRVVDKESGAPLRGVAVVIKGTEAASVTGGDGGYRLTGVPEGVWDVGFIKSGYIEATVTGLAVTQAKTAKLDFILVPRPSEMSDEVFELQDFTVSVEEAQSMVMEFAALRNDSVASINILGSEDFSKYAASDIGDAVKRVSGVTVEGGKYAVIRGLGDRYTSTTLNGLPLASPDPDRLAVQLDLFPSSLFETVVVTKTFTPDQPGTATGGIDLKLKGVPEEAFVSFSASVGWHSVATGNDKFLTNDRGSSDDRWASGADERALPSVATSFPANLTKPVFPLPIPIPPALAGTFITAAQRDAAVAETRAINATLGNNYSAFGKAPGPDYGYKLSFGDVHELRDGIKVGYVAGLNYKREHRMEEDATYFRSATETSGTDTLSPAVFVDPDRAIGYQNQTLNESSTTNSLSWLVGGGVKFGEDHTISVSHLELQMSEDVNTRVIGDRYMQFPFSGDGDQLDTEFRESLHYTERKLVSNQVQGVHVVDLGDGVPFGGVSFNWAFGKDNTSQDEPGFVQTSAILLDSGDLTIARNSTSAGTPSPSFIIWRTIDEERANSRLDLKLEDEFFENYATSLKFGQLRSEAERDFFDESLGLNGDNLNSATDTTIPGPAANPDRPLVGNNDRFVTAYEVNADVTLQTETLGRYFMVEQQVAEKFRLIGGYRYEKNKADVRSNQPPKLRGAGANNPLAGLPTTGGYDDERWLPSFTAIYQPNKNLNLRAAFSETLALPSSREVSPYASSVFSGSDVDVGNPDLQPSDIENLDFGISYVRDNGDSIGVSVFGKKVSGRIERINGIGADTFKTGLINPDPFDYDSYAVTTYSQNLGSSLYSWYNNPDTARIKGVEFEGRKSLDFIASELSVFSVGGNFSVIQGETKRMPIEVAAKNKAGRPVSSTRALTNQPDQILNLDLTYDNPDSGLRVSLIYYRVSESLAGAALLDSYDIYNGGYDALDLTASKRIGEHFKVGLSIKNITNSVRENYYDVEGAEVVADRYKIGRSVSISGTIEF